MAMGSGDLSPDSRKNFTLLKSMGSKGADVTFIEDLKTQPPSSFDYIIDGIFGTGLNSEVRSPISGIIEKLNTSATPIFAMDLPSGLNSDDGTIHGTCIRAHATYTFGSNKIGFHLNHSDSYTGEITFIDLPFPSHIRQHKAILINKLLTTHLPLQDRNARHKYDDGVVHILAGSEGLTGAGIMSAQSAWKQGAGAVFLYTPKKHLHLYETNLPQIIKVGLGDDNSSYLKPEFSKNILDRLQSKKRSSFSRSGTWQ